MNKIYRVIWSKTKNCYVVASELAKRHTKAPQSGVVNKIAALALVGAMSFGFAGSALAAQVDDTYIKIGMTGELPDGITVNPASITGGNFAIAIGVNTNVSGDANDVADFSVGVGFGATATGINGLALGKDATMTASHAIGVGAGSRAEGMYSTVMGAYSDVSINPAVKYPLDPNVSDNDKDLLQGFGTTVLGSLNSSRTTIVDDTATDKNKDKAFISVASSIIGTVNTATDSNGALIFGAGNSITDSYQSVIFDEAETSIDDLRTQYKAAVKNGDRSAMAEITAKLQKMVKVSGGQVMTMGGSNTATNAYRSQLVGVGNVLEGGEDGPTSITVAGQTYYEYKTQYDLLDGFENKVTESEHVSIIGTGNTVEKSNGNIIFGDYHQLKGGAEDENGNKVGGNNVIIGSAAGSFKYVDSETGKMILSFEASEETKHEENISNTVMVGHLANAKISEGVALGYSSLANTDKGVQGFDPATGTASELTSKTWKATAAAVSVGNDLKKTWYGFDENTIQANINKYKSQLEALGVDTTLAPADLLDSLNEEQMQLLVDNVAHQTQESETKPVQAETLYVAKPGSGITRQITNVAAGFNDTDAVNVAQLKASQTHYYSVNDNGTPMGNYNNEGAKGKFSLAAGPDAKAEGLLSTVVGAGNYSQDTIVDYLGTIKETIVHAEGAGSGIGNQVFRTIGPYIEDVPSVMGVGSTVIGSMNSVKNRDEVVASINNLHDTLYAYSAARYTLPALKDFLNNADLFDGIANTVVGTMNETAKANAAVIYGTGNTVKNAYEVLDPAFDGELLASKVQNSSASVADLQALLEELDFSNIDSLKDAIKTGNVDQIKSLLQGYINNDKDSNYEGKGGRIIAIGTSNEIENAVLSQLIGTNNQLHGLSASSLLSTTVKPATYTILNGYGNEATGASYSTLIGTNNELYGYSSSGLFSATVTPATYTILNGYGNKAYRTDYAAIVGNSNTIGTTSRATSKAIVLGDSNTITAGSNNDIVIGTVTDAVGASGAGNIVSVGYNTKLTAANSIGIGAGNTVTGTNSIAIGKGHTVSGNNSGAFGDPSTILGDGSYAIGNNNSIGKEIKDNDTSTIVKANDSFILGSNASITSTDNKSVVVGGVALGKNAIIEDTSGSVALGQNSKVLKVDAPTVGGYNPLTGETAYTDGTQTWTATTGPVSVGSSSVTRQMKYVAAGSADTDAVNVAQLKSAETHYYGVNDTGIPKENYDNSGATGIDSVAAGIAVGTAANFSAVTGSYSSMANASGLQGTGASAFGIFNTIDASEETDAHDGIGNSLVGLANSTSNANGTVIIGTGNEITNSVGNLTGYDAVSEAYAAYSAAQAMYNADPSDENLEAVNGAYSDLQDAMKTFAKSAPEDGGDVLAIGGANTADYALKSSMIGVKNSITGSEGAEAEFNSTIGYGNTIANGSNNSIIGTNRTISDVDGVIVIGSAASELATSVDNSVVIGTEANVTLEDKESVALGSYSKADKLGGYETTGDDDVEIGTLKLSSSKFAGTGDNVVGTVSIGYVPEQKQKSRAATDNEEENVKTRTLTYVGAGEISATSTDAINGSQLYYALDAMQFDIVAGDNVEVIKNTDDTGHTVYTIHSLNAMVQAGPSGNVTVTDEVGDGKTNGVTTDLTSDGAGTTAGNGAGDGTTGGTTATTPEPTPSEKPIGPLAPGEDKPNEHTTVYTVDAKDTYVEKGEVTQAATDDSDKVVTTFTHNYGTTFDVDSNNTYVSKAEVTQEATDDNADVKVKLTRNDGKSFDLDLKDRYVSKAEVTQEATDDNADVKVKLTRNDGESFNLDLKDRYVSKAEVTQKATDESDEVKVQLTRNDGESFDLAMNNTYVAKAEVTQAATDESDKVKVQLTRNDGKSFDLDLNNTYVAKAEVTQQATDTSDDVTIELSRNDGKSFELATKNTYLANAELKDHTLTLGRNDGTEFVVNDLATLDDGMSYEGDTGSATVKLNNTVSVTGGATELTDGNIGVAASQDGENAKLEIKLAKDIKDVDSITVNKNIKVGDNTTIEGDTITTKTVNADTVKAGGTTVDDNGLTTDDGNGPSVTKDGIDAGKKKITNVERGTADTDAVNYSQLKEASGNIYNELNRLDDRTRKGLAGAAALAALHPMDFNPDDKMQFSAGIGHYRGENAAAIGAFYRPDESVMFSIGGVIGNGDNMINAGITFGLDGTRNRITRSRTAMAREIQDLRSLVTQMAARMDRLEGANIETAMFPDVPENHWAYEYVEDLQKRGALKGYPDGLFKGDRAMTRYEFAAMLDRLVRSGVTLDSRVAKEFEPELGRIYVERISGQDNDRKKVERVRVNNSDSKYPEGKTRDVYGSKIVTAVPKQA